MQQNHIQGTENNDFLTDTILDDDIFALDGDDQIRVSSGNDLVDGGDGNDELAIDYSESTENLNISINDNLNWNWINENDGWIDIHDSLLDYNTRINFYSVESFVINSGSGNDFIERSEPSYRDFSNEIIYAGAGNDTISAGLGLGNDIIDGGTGFDILRLNYRQSPNSITSSLISKNSGQYSDGLNIVSFNNIEAVEVLGSNYDDVLVAIEDANDDRNISSTINVNVLIDGNDGEDRLVADYSERTEDLTFNLTFRDYIYHENSSINVYSKVTDYSSRVDFNSIESFSITGGKGNDSFDLRNGDSLTIEGGSGSDTYFYESYGTNIISDYAGDNDTIVLDQRITLDRFDLYFNDSDLIFRFDNSNGRELVLENYLDSNDHIENVKVEDRIVTIEELLVLKSVPNVVNERSGNDFVNSYLDRKKVNGGAGFDVLKADFHHSHTAIFSSLNNANSGQYSNGFDTLEFSFFEAVQIEGSRYDDILVALNPENIIDYEFDNFYAGHSFINGREGQDSLVADYSHRIENLKFDLQTNFYNDNFDLGWMDVYSPTTNDYYSYIEFLEIENFIINSGNGNDEIDLDRDNLSNIIFDGGGGFDVLTVDFYDNQTGIDSSLTNSNSGQYSDGINTVDFSNIEAIEVMGSRFDDVLVAVTANNIGQSSQHLIMNSIIHGREGEDRLVADYTSLNENLVFNFNYYSIDVYSSESGDYNSRIEFYDIENFTIISGNGNDYIGLHYPSNSKDRIIGGLGDDTIDGGKGNDIFVYERGHGMDIISDSSGDNDTIAFSGISLDNISLNFEDNDLVLNVIDSPGDRLTIKDYANSTDSIEHIEFGSQIFSVEEVIALKSTPEPQTMGEFGQVDNFDHNSQTIQFDRSYENPVVFALPLSRNGGDPSIVRITDIQDDSFTAYLQEAEYKDGAHTKESFSYMVLEAGTWELDNGALLEVGSVNTSLVTTEGWEEIDFDTDFADTPVVLSQVQSNNGNQFVRTRQNQASVDGFNLSLEEEEALKNSGHAHETVGWLAIDTGQGNWGELEYEAKHTGREVNHSYYNLGFDQEFTSEPSLFASIASFYGGDSSGLRYKNLSQTQVHIMVEEDQSLDSETLHTNEIVDFLAIAGTGDLAAIAYEPDSLG